MKRDHEPRKFVLRIRNANEHNEYVFFGCAYVLKMHRLQNITTIHVELSKVVLLNFNPYI